MTKVNYKKHPLLKSIDWNNLSATKATLPFYSGTRCWYSTDCCYLRALPVPAVPPVSFRPSNYMMTHNTSYSFFSDCADAVTCWMFACSAGRLWVDGKASIQKFVQHAAGVFVHMLTHQVQRDFNSTASTKETAIYYICLDGKVLRWPCSTYIC